MALADYFAAHQQDGLTRPTGSWLRDICVVAGLLVIVAVMILPLPLFIIDALIATNFAFGIGMVLFAMFVRDTTELTVFPSLLLISTLYRLSISVATTRMILMHGHGGEIIEAFGMMVVGGNIVIGLVVFMIITIVQFLVIAKGAERVSEVAARFSLDAMPGKQMSIDSDLRSGLLESDEARRKRKHLEMENKMHGALDGAMKYVKGDAMASIVIVLVNLVGGFAIGAIQQGLPASEALRVYSILSIGDGLVAQVPALLGAMSAGLLVTRGSDEDRDRHMGDAIFRQLGANPRVFVVSGVVLMLMATIPGFPTVVFLLLGGLMATTAAFFEPTLRVKLRRNLALVRESSGAKALPAKGVVSTEPLAASPVVPLYLEIEGAPTAWTAELVGRQMRETAAAIERDLGVALPPVSIRLTPSAETPGWRLYFWESRRAAGEIDHAADPGSLAAHIGDILRRNIGEFLGLQEASDLLTRAGESYPEPVKELMRMLPLTRVAEVFRLLLAEQVPLRPIRDVLEALVEHCPIEKHPPVLVGLIRRSIQQRLMPRIASDGILRAIILAPELETALTNVVEDSGELLLAPDRRDALVADIASAAASGGAAALVCASVLRWPLRQLICAELPMLHILAYDELHASVRFELVGTVAMTGGAGPDPAPGFEAGDAVPA